MMSEAKTRIDVMGVANLGLASHSQTADMLRACASRNVEIRILQCAPTNPALGSLVGARNAEQLDSAKGQIHAATDAWKRLGDGRSGDSGDRPGRSACAATEPQRRTITTPKK